MKKNYDILDLVKFICALMVIAIHSNLFPQALYPWLRIAVPIFFLISSYLLFSKINDSPDDKWKIIKKYIIGNLKYYAFWFVVLIPATIYSRVEWLDNPPLEIIRIFITQALFSSTFPVSWFIVGSIWGALIIGLVSGKLKNKVLIPLFFLVFIICCIKSSYPFIIDGLPVLHKISKIYEKIFTSPVFSFPIASCWMFVGKLFADNKKVKTNKKINIPLLLVSCILLYIEWKYVYKYSGNYSNDCYIMLLPVAIFIFASVKDININLKYAKELRYFSKISFPLHYCFAKVYSILLKDQNVLIVYILTVISCAIACCIIKKLENKIKILKLSH